ncbi:uncharacterized protein K460DRAFT_406047 [Cucurbitaria berberidis CBS 394.84]|uniref:Stress-associated endoplasmic reticulum protein n=1 Tax=Cucurbitaria berberidis CBS 394.84 TaxID=1168544 RepID=A0A9P4L8Y9_9PLEO|nr:uncharacterized protein K460DRAFT_406047 [Cucurbitaria berberidis CBS 394.84]KAF1845813.1 hypothetical protein K460DRAFT_406047 [Cucurbitaria berberidis CBS 394.84]
MVREREFPTPLATALTRAAQTPQQRQANMRFAKAQEKKMGRPEQIITKKQGPQKSPISKIWIILLGFVLCGGVLFELVKLFF